MPRQGPVRGIVGVRLSDQQRADAEQRALAAGHVKASGEPNLSDQVRADLDDAAARNEAAQEVLREMVTPLSDGTGVLTGMVLLHCDQCDEIHELAVARYWNLRDDTLQRQATYCPRRRTIVNGTYRPGTASPTG